MFKKIASVIALITFVVCLFVGCTSVTPETGPHALAAGYDLDEVDGDSLRDDYCAYKSNTNIFDLNNVSIDYSYGWVRRSASCGPVTVKRFVVPTDDEAGINWCVEYDKGNVFASLENERIDLHSHASAYVSETYYRFFDQIGNVFDGLLAKTGMPEDGQTVVVQEAETLRVYAQFAYSAKDLYNNAKNPIGRQDMSELFAGEFVGLNTPVALLFSEGTVRNVTEYQNAIARVFGCADRETLAARAQIIADTYVGKENVPNDERLLNDGGVQTVGGATVLPYVVRSNVTTPCCVLVIVKNGRVFFWVSDMEKIVSIANAEQTSVEVFLYSRCALVEASAERSESLSDVKVCLFNAANEEKAVVLKNDFDYSSQEYECFIEFDQDWNVTKIRYNHTEKVTVPRDLFEGEKGLIYFATKGVQEGKEKPISSIGLYYRVNGNKVTLSQQMPEE